MSEFKVGDRVRLKAMPEKTGRVHTVGDGTPGVAISFDDGGFAGRFPDEVELAPERMLSITLPESVVRHYADFAAFSYETETDDGETDDGERRGWAVIDACKAALEVLEAES